MCLNIEYSMLFSSFCALISISGETGYSIPIQGLPWGQDFCALNQEKLLMDVV